MKGGILVPQQYAIDMTRLAALAALFLVTSSGFSPGIVWASMTSTSVPSMSEAVLGCWTRQKYVPDDGSYWSLCFFEDGNVDSTVISGPPNAGLSGTASDGSYEIANGKAKFTFDAGDYGWLWQSGAVFCDVRSDGHERLAFTNCSGGEADMLFGRSRPARE